MSDDITPSVPVAIVGGGPAGLMLALLLDRHGVKSVVFNLEDGSRLHPKGSTQNARTMEHYRRLGIAEHVRDLGLPRDHPTDVAFFTRINAWELARLRMPSTAEKMRGVADGPTTDQIPEPLHRANQMYVEKYLLDHVGTRPNIVLRFGWRVENFTEDQNGVSLQAERGDGGASEHWRARYLVGCDGGQGLVRRSRGIRYHGFESLQLDFFGGKMLATYLRAPTIYRDCVGHRRAFHYGALNPELRLQLISLDGAGEFLLFSKVTEENPEPSAAEVAHVVQRAGGAEIPVEILGQTPWTAGVAVVAERFSSGRVFLAGDAAHLFTPTGGFGMNTGIDDTANLAWKLAAVLQGWGGSLLLHSYESERMPIAVRNTTAARQLARNVGEMRIPPDIELDAPAGVAARREFGAMLSTLGEEYASIGVQLGARYDGSPIIVADGAPPADNYIEYIATSIPGGRTPHVWMDTRRGAGSSLFDQLGAGFTLLRLGDKAPDAGPIEAAARAQQVPLKVLQVRHPDARALYERDLALIRPDQHVAWRGNSFPADVGHLIASVVGNTDCS